MNDYDYLILTTGSIWNYECIRRNQAQAGSKPDPLAFSPGVCSDLFSSGGPTPTPPPANFYPALFS